MRSTIIIGTILLFGGIGTAIAETKSAVHDISQAQFVENCEDMGGNAIEGSSHASCELPGGTEITCSFQPPGSDSPGGLCEVDSRLASTNLKDLLGDAPLGMGSRPVPQSLTSSDSGSSADAGPVTGGGKGSYAGGAGSGTDSASDTDPDVK